MASLEDVDSKIRLMKRKVRDERPKKLPGRYLVKPHADWLADGYKKMIVATKPYKEYSDQEIYIIGEDGIHGTMIEGEPEGPFKTGQLLQSPYRDMHRITIREWITWWGSLPSPRARKPKKDKFWIWRPKIIKKFQPPLEYEIPKGVQIYIKEVKPKTRPTLAMMLVDAISDLYETIVSRFSTPQSP